MVTKGEWKITKWNEGHGFNVFADEGFVASVPMNVGLEHTIIESEANANLIVSAVNACVSVNPDNPQAVAESIKDMYEALKALVKQFKCVEPRYHTDNDKIELANKALSNAEGKNV